MGGLLCLECVGSVLMALPIGRLRLRSTGSDMSAVVDTEITSNDGALCVENEL